MTGPFLGGYKEVTRYTGELGGGLSRRTISRHLAEIDHVQVGGRVLFTRAAIDSWLARHRVPAKAVEGKGVDVEAIRGIVRRVVGGSRKSG